MITIFAFMAGFCAGGLFGLIVAAVLIAGGRDE